MANISQVKVGDTTYNIKDSLAAQLVYVSNLPEANEDGSNLVVLFNGKIYIKTVSPSEGLSYTLSNNQYSVSGIGTCTDTDVIIPDIYQGLPVTSIGNSAFRNCSGLTSITIPDSVTSIGDSAFERCSSLTSITIPDGIISIGTWAFYDCYRLVEVINKSSHITLEKSSSNNGYVAYYAFAVYNSGDAFTGTKLSNDNGYIIYTDGQEKILVGYNGTETDLTLPSYITKINQHAFNNESLTSLVIPDSVTSIGEKAVYGCNKLISVVIGNSVASIGSYAFYNCNFLENVIMGNNVAFIDDFAFCYCFQLASVIIPNSAAFIGSSAFQDCWSLKNATFSNPIGWEVGDTADFAQGEGMLVTLDDLAQNATYLNSTYFNKYWKRFDTTN